MLEEEPKSADFRRQMLPDGSKLPKTWFGVRPQIHVGQVGEHEVISDWSHEFESAEVQLRTSAVYWYGQKNAVGLRCGHWTGQDKIDGTHVIGDDEI